MIKPKIHVWGQNDVPSNEYLQDLLNSTHIKAGIKRTRLKIIPKLHVKLANWLCLLKGCLHVNTPPPHRKMLHGTGELQTCLES